MSIASPVQNRRNSYPFVAISRDTSRSSVYRALKRGWYAPPDKTQEFYIGDVDARCYLAGATGKINALECAPSSRIVFVAFTKCESWAPLLPVFKLRSKRGKLLDDTSSRIRWPFKNTLLVDQRSILYS